MSKITVIVNQKGRAGKTTTAINLSYTLSEEEKILLIDFNQQVSLTVALGNNGDDKSKKSRMNKNLRWNKVLLML